MSYGTNNRGGGYGGNSRRSGSGHKSGKGKGRFNPLAKAKEVFSKRSEQSRIQDLTRIAQVAPNIDAYIQDPNKFDIPYVDMPKSQQETIEQLCRLASKEPCDVTIKDKEAKKSKRVRIVKKETVKSEIEKAVKEAEDKMIAELMTSENSPILEDKPKRRLPTQEEILAEAQQIWLKDNNAAVHEGFFEGVSAPEKGELAEEGYLQKAKLKLMTTQDTFAERQTSDYLDSMRQQLNKLGFDIVPISGFESIDLRF
ncbi:MAG: hypothetical protein M1490_04695 [Candidatus Bathyarchaeota archaeon]|nr:hypothetical protein [Candidatus Bathyarchaeota archaeon]